MWILIAIVAQTAHADVTHLRIELLVGAEEQIALAQVGKILFVDDMMHLYDNADNLLGITPLAQIEKITFSEQTTPTGSEEVTDLDISIFPNPAHDCLLLRGVTGTQTLRIFSLQGQLLESAVSSEGGAQLHVGNLQNGTYLLQVGAQVVKFIKE